MTILNSTGINAVSIIISGQKELIYIYSHNICIYLHRFVFHMVRLVNLVFPFLFPQYWHPFLLLFFIICTIFSLSFSLEDFNICEIVIIMLIEFPLKTENIVVVFDLSLALIGMGYYHSGKENYVHI